MNSRAESFSFSGRVRSGLYAIQGIVELLKGQHNAWIHAFATFCVIAAGAVLLSAMGAVVVGLVIFVPHLLGYL